MTGVAREDPSDANRRPPVPDGVADQAERRARFVRSLVTIDLSLEYYAGTLLAEGTSISLSFQTTCIGYEERQIHGRSVVVETRQACLVHPVQMAALWTKIGETHLVVGGSQQLAVFARAGGNALLASGVVRQHFAQHLEPTEVVPVGLIGGKALAALAPETFKRRPTPKLRARILKRDKYRCLLCGERPANNEHVTLQVHHIQPWGHGGLTEEENLITLCHTCHGGLQPHHDPELFQMNGHLHRALGADGYGSYQAGVDAYRALIKRRADQAGGTSGTGRSLRAG